MSDRFPARRSRGGDLAAPIAGALLLVALASLVLGFSHDPGIDSVVLACAAVILAGAGCLAGLWAIGYRRLRYSLTESALRVDWLGRTLVLPYAAIQGIYAGQRLAGNATPGRLGWPGINVGTRRVRGMGKLRFLATSSDQSQLTLITVENGGLAISARDPAEFQAALIERVERSPEADEALSWSERAPSAAPWTALADWWLPLGVAVGTLMLLLILAIIGVRYPELPSDIPIHFDVGGDPTQIAPKSDLLRLPLLGLFCLVLNWALGIVVHPRERTLARLLWLLAICVQLVLLVGVVRIVA